MTVRRPIFAYLNFVLSALPRKVSFNVQTANLGLAGATQTLVGNVMSAQMSIVSTVSAIQICILRLKCLQLSLNEMHLFEITVTYLN